MVRRTNASRLPLYLLLVLVSAGAVLRLLRLTWQPLWWDEGYSVYFATEPLLSMLRLTAEDIHPPLYYALLHAWLLAWGSAAPLALRTFSILIGVLSLPAVWWLARTLFPRRPGLALWAAFLLVISPMHIFYSQEVRMYGLELLLGVLSTAFFWRISTTPQQHWSPDRLLYALTTTALLYTEYYAVFLPAAHFLWGIWRARTDRVRLFVLLTTGAAVAVLYLPWLIYAIPSLLNYIPAKVMADADLALSPPVYVWRHMVAFLGGHVLSADVVLRRLQLVSVAASLLVLTGVWLATWLRQRRQVNDPAALADQRDPSPLSLLTTILVVSFAVGIALNLRLPFFPEGGERILLFVLPYFLLILAYGGSAAWSAPKLTRAASFFAGALLILGAGLGVYAFFTVPRYADNDYRPLIRQIVQQGRAEDTVFAVFPWQIGYWRAYAPVWGRNVIPGPDAMLSPSQGWDESVALTLDEALDRGSLWFPAHLALGAFLEREVEAHLASHAVEFENRWYSKTTRLSGWHQFDGTNTVAVARDVNFGPVLLRGESSVSGSPVRSANEVLPIQLFFTVSDPEDVPLVIALRLLDEQDRVWASRDIQIDEGDPLLYGTARNVGLLVPPGLPPGVYRVGLGVRPAAAIQLLPVETSAGMREIVSIGNVQVIEPAEVMPAIHLPIQVPLSKPVHRDGVDFLGFSGYDPDVPTLAGTELSLSLFFKKNALSLPPYKLYVGLTDKSGQGVAGWEGWPLSDYPTSVWPENALVRVPVAFYVPAALTAGEYTLVAGLVDPATGQRSAPVELGALPISQREIRLDVPTPQYPLPSPLQVGTHARLLGYDLAVEDEALSVVLYWEVLQTLLPPHQVFFHLVDAGGTILAQDDGVPGRRAISAPSGTWLAGEIIVDPHVLPYPVEGIDAAMIRTGLYVPSTGVRLPIMSGEQVIGDSIDLPLP